MISRINTLLVGTALAGGVVLTAWGFAHMQWPQDLPWTYAALPRYLIFLIICTVLVISGSYWSKRSPLFIGAVIGIGIGLLSGALWPLLVTLWFFLSATILGRGILTKLGIKLVGESHLTRFLVGAGAYGTAVGLCAHFPINYPGVYGLALALPILFSWRKVIAQSSKLFCNGVPKNPATFSLNWLDAAIAVVALVYFVVAFMPEVGYDSLAMHLFIPAHLATRHQWGFDASTYVWAVIPMLGDWIFAIGYMLANETAARLINVGFIFVLVWVVRDIVVWAGGSAIGARWAALIFLATPLTFTVGSSLFIESVWASFAVAGTLAVLKAATTSGNSRLELPVSGTLLGYALAAKAITFTILPGLLLLLVWRYRSWYKTVGLPFLSQGVALFLAIGMIPYATAWRLTGNPVFPLFNKIFQSPFYRTTENFDNPLFNAGFTWDVFYRVTFDSGRYLEAYAGASGFQWLLLFIPASIAIIVSRNTRGVALILVGIFAIALAFHSQSYLRYTFPAWALLTATIGVALGATGTTNRFIKYGWYAAAVITVTLNLLFINAGAFYRDFALGSILDQSSRDKYLLARLPIRSAIELVNRLNVEQMPVAVFSHPQTAGLSANALYPNWYNQVFQEEIATVQTEQEVANILLRRAVDFVILDANWNGVGGLRGLETRALIEKISEKQADYGSISVRKIKSDYRFRDELLINPNFTSISGWVLAPEAKYDADSGVVLVSVASSAAQAIAVSAGRHYLNTVVARCASKKTWGRIQINWLDKNGKFVRADLKVFECSSDWAEHTLEGTVPANVVKAIVYTAGHTPIPLEFKSNSFRQ